ERRARAGAEAPRALEPRRSRPRRAVQRKPAQQVPARADRRAEGSGRARPGIRVARCRSPALRIGKGFASMRRRVLVTGGAGFIGSHVVEAHLAAGDDVTVLDNLSSGRRENVPAGTRLVEADVRSPEARTLLAEQAF